MIQESTGKPQLLKAGERPFAYVEKSNPRTSSLELLTYPNSDAESYFYDSVGNLTRKTTPEAQNIDFLYDSINRRTKQDASDDVQWYYDDVANVTKLRLSRDNGSNWDDNVYQYEQRNRLTKTTLPDSKTLTYYYNGIGARTKMTDVASNNITYLYDNVHRLTNVAKGGSAHASYYYDDAGRRTKLLLGNSTYAAYLYDNANRLTSLHNKKSNATVISSFQYLVDDVGNRTKMTLAGGDYLEYIYDDAWQLTKETRKDSQAATQYYNEFLYDGVGNRTTLYYYDAQDTVTTSYLHNAANQLTQDADGTTTNTYTYDDNGNLTRKNDGASNFDYFWDEFNRLTRYDAPGANNDGTYLYDQSWRRMTTTVGGTTTAFFYDGADVIGEYGGGAWQRTYVTPMLDQNVSITTGGSTYHYHQDGLGSVRNLTDSNETAQNSYDYYAFGSVYGNPTENVTQPFRFTGRRWDAERGEYFHRYRNYNPESGRFDERDPLGRGSCSNFYTYVSNGPLNYADPMGLQRSNVGRCKGKPTKIGKIYMYPKQQCFADCMDCCDTAYGMAFRSCVLKLRILKKLRCFLELYPRLMNCHIMSCPTKIPVF